MIGVPPVLIPSLQVMPILDAEVIATSLASPTG